MDDWEIVLAQARKYLDLDIEWTSLEERVKYRFKEIHNNKIVIERMSGGSPAIITQKSVVEAVDHLKKD